MVIEILNSSAQGVKTAQALINTETRNITNAATEGFVKRVQQPETFLPTGSVEPSQVTRQFINPFLVQELRDAISARSFNAELLENIEKIDRLSGDPADEIALSNAISGLGDAFQLASNFPTSAASFQGIVAEAQDVVETFQTVVGGLTTIRDDVRTEVVSDVDNANKLIERIADLNLRIGQLSAANQDITDLEDQRDLAINDLAELMTVNVIDGPNEVKKVFTGDFQLLVDTKPRPVNLTIDPTQSPPDDLVIGIGTANTPIEDVSLGGKLGAFRPILEEIDARLTQLDEIATTLVASFDDPGNFVQFATSAGPTADVVDLDLSGTLSLTDNGPASIPANHVIEIVADDGTVPPNTLRYVTTGDEGDLTGLATALAGTTPAGFTIASVAGANPPRLTITDGGGNPITVSATLLEQAGQTTTTVAAGVQTSTIDLNGTFGTSNGASPEFPVQGNARISLFDAAGVEQATGLVAFTDPPTQTSLADFVTDAIAALAAEPGFAGFTAVPTADGNGIVVSDPGGSTFTVVVGVEDTSAFSGPGTRLFTTGGNLTNTTSDENPPITIDTTSIPVRATGIIEGLSGVLQVNPDIVQDPALLRGPSTSPVGANDNLIRGRDVFFQSFEYVTNSGSIIADLSDGLPEEASLAAAAGEFSANIGGVALALSAENAVLTDTEAFLGTTVAAEGEVNIDEVLTRLIILQNLFAGSARVISVGTALFDTLINLGR